MVFYHIRDLLPHVIIFDEIVGEVFHQGGLEGSSTCSVTSRNSCRLSWVFVSLDDIPPVGMTTFLVFSETVTIFCVICSSNFLKFDSPSLRNSSTQKLCGCVSFDVSVPSSEQRHTLWDFVYTLCWLLDVSDTVLRSVSLPMKLFTEISTTREKALTRCVSGPTTST